MSLIAVVERISDITEETFGELCLRKCLDASEVEHVESGHASVVNTMSQLTLKLLHLFLKVDLVEEQSGHLFLNLLLCCLAGVRGTLLVVAPPTKIFRCCLPAFRRSLHLLDLVNRLKRASFTNFFITKIFLVKLGAQVLGSRPLVSGAR